MGAVDFAGDAQIWDFRGGGGRSDCGCTILGELPECR